MIKIRSYFSEIPWETSLFSWCREKISIGFLFEPKNNFIQETVASCSCNLQDRVRAVTSNGRDVWDKKMALILKSIGSGITSI